MSKRKMQSRAAQYSANQQKQARQNNADAKKNILALRQQKQPEAVKAEPESEVQPVTGAVREAPLAADPAQLEEERRKLRAEQAKFEEKQQKFCAEQQELENARQQLKKDQQEAEQMRKTLAEEESRLKRQKLLQDGTQASLDAQKQILDSRTEQFVKQQNEWLEQQKKKNDELAAREMEIQQLRNNVDTELAAKRMEWMSQIRTDMGTARAAQMNKAEEATAAYEKSRRQDLETELSKLRTEKKANLEAELTAERNAWKEKKAEEQKALDAERKTNEQIRQKLEAREEKLDERENGMDDQLNQKDQEKIEAIREKEKECRALRLELVSAEEKASSLEEQVNAQRKSLAAFEAFESTWGSSPEILQRNLKDLQAENANLKQKINDLPPKDLEKKYQDLEIEKNTIDVRCKNLEDQNKKLRIDTAELQTLRETRADQEEKVSKAELDAATARKENEELRGKLERFLRPEAQKQDRDERIKALSIPYLTDIPVQQKQQPENEIEWLQSIQDQCRDYGIVFPRRLLYAFHTALKIADWSSITILSGISGTGKSELPRLYSLFGGINFYSVPVQPNWDSQESMLGYFNSIDNRFEAKELLRFLVQSTNRVQDTKNENGEEKKGLRAASEFPWPLGQYMSIVLLDEMNLAHVEHYFAEFLSKLETRRGLEKGDVPTIDVNLGAGCEPYKLPLRRNVLWVGTMNQDETTKTLSDKVLDRGITITFPTPKKLESRPEMKKLPNKASDHILAYKTWNGWCRSARSNNSAFQKRMDRYRSIVEEINEQMGKSGRAVGHRVWQSIEYYITNYPAVIAERKALVAQENAAEQDAGAAKTSTCVQLEEYELEKPDTPLSDGLTRAMDIAFEDQLVQKIMPKLRGIEDTGSGKEQLDEIWTILENNGFQSLQEDFEKARQYGYGEFFWNSAEYLERDLLDSGIAVQMPADGWVPTEVQS